MVTHVVNRGEWADLHSTMVLLKFASKYVTFSSLKKSTFHYGSIKIIFTHNQGIACVWSTFHYGSIKIIFKILIIPFIMTSTFHYGSIKIQSLKNHYQ